MYEFIKNCTRIFRKKMYEFIEIGNFFLNYL